MAALKAELAGLRRFGSAALDLAWVAAGRFDAFWERGLSPWDIAAGVLLVREAGGFVSDLDGGDAILTKGSVAAGNDTMHRELVRLMKEAGKQAANDPPQEAKESPAKAAVPAPAGRGTPSVPELGRGPDVITAPQTLPQISSGNRAFFFDSACGIVRLNRASDVR